MEFNRITNAINKSQIVLPRNINLHVQDENDNTLLHLAAAQGDLNKIDKLIKRHPYLLEAKNKFGSTPLHYATWLGQSSIVEYLMEQGADIKTKDIYDQTLMHAAAWNDDLKLVKYFFKKGLSLEEKDLNGNTSLLSAAKNNHLNIVKFFVIKGADIAVHDNEGNNIFMIAAKNGYLKIIDYIAREKKIDLSAMEMEDNNLVENLLQLGAKIDPAKPRSNVHVHQIHQDKPEELGRYVLKQNEDLLANSTLPEAYPKQKKVKRTMKKARHFFKLQEAVKDAFDMQGLNDSLNPMVSATGFFQNHLQAHLQVPQSQISPFNLSSISDGSMGMNHSNASQRF